MEGYKKGLDENDGVAFEKWISELVPVMEQFMKVYEKYSGYEMFDKLENTLKENGCNRADEIRYAINKCGYIFRKALRFLK